MILLNPQIIALPISVCVGHSIKTSKGSNPLIQAFFGWRAVTFPIERNQSLTAAYVGQQGWLIVFHDIDHELYAKSESGDEHIPFRDRGYVGNAFGEFL